APSNVRRWKLSRSQVFSLVAIAMLSLGLEALIVFTLVQGRATAVTYQQRGNAASAVQRTDREMLRLQVVAAHGLDTDNPDLEALTRQRSVLATQWHILALELDDADPLVASQVRALEAELASHDALIDGLRA